MTDAEKLRLLSIFHYVVAALAALTVLLPTFHLFMGIMMLTGGFGEPADEEFPVRMMGGFFTAFAVLFILGALTVAALLIAAGRFLAARTHYTYCVVVAACSTIFVPFGTVLGVFTILTLVREPVRAMFEPAPSG
ncbi:MAG: hypothetical protein ACRD2J_02070 [Thermoanaerobaculia bacterium]